ncbi:uncharacterized protein K452DRAFT_305064 [Aplosporella prunicola CBS 121167]|uniref:Uncharacterized protein n=1 Tax=Aplosporella prunicola CBS 121167 TaxID=1176127 RepID=A0A6A6BPL7_9PEZI|nr:uncharacterized protein K452DRAFT_305064 [Aplosporella prunicola CBS 121167]KAF2146079.1 hypothetical protein K452DRAFT_305064 [Aplosporella prunicola CBS 121167]
MRLPTHPSLSLLPPPLLVLLQAALVLLLARPLHALPQYNYDAEGAFASRLSALLTPTAPALAAFPARTPTTASDIALRSWTGGGASPAFALLVSDAGEHVSERAKAEKGLFDEQGKEDADDDERKLHHHHLNADDGEEAREGKALLVFLDDGHVDADANADTDTTATITTTRNVAMPLPTAPSLTQSHRHDQQVLDR